MRYVKSLVESYAKIGSSILALIAAEAFIQLINAAFFLVLLIYFNKQGYPDYEAAGFVSYRFLGVVLVALPVGIYARGRRLLPLFYAASVMVPLLSLLILWGIEKHFSNLISIAMFFWGVFFNFITVVVNPFIIRNCDENARSEAFALSYASNSLASIVCGLLAWVLTSGLGFDIGERNVMFVIITLSLLALPLLRFVDRNENIEYLPQLELFEPDFESSSKKSGKRNLPSSLIQNYDWKIIFHALFPTLVIAIGAGFTIPFVSLFFFTVHHVDTDIFSLIGTITAILVTLLALLVPNLLKKWGFKKSITGTQIVAVTLLVLFSTTEWYAQWQWAAWLAAIFYISRQPLMNMTGPMTTELVLNYVGTRNREIISALTSAIWSGSWFFSSIIFKWLREAHQPYVNIFLITGAMYALGVVFYYRLIMAYEEKINISSN